MYREALPIDKKIAATTEYTEICMQEDSEKLFKIDDFFDSLQNIFQRKNNRDTFATYVQWWHKFFFQNEIS